MYLPIHWGQSLQAYRSPSSLRSICVYVCVYELEICQSSRTRASRLTDHQQSAKHVYVRIFVYAYDLRICTDQKMQAYIPTSSLQCMYACIYPLINTSKQKKTRAVSLLLQEALDTALRTCTYACMHVRVCLCVCMCVYVCVCIHTQKKITYFEQSLNLHIYS
jgi:hypothetical protein